MAGSSYPTTSKFTEFLKQLEVDGNKIPEIAPVMREVLQSYEHGEADPEDVFGGIPEFDLSSVDDEHSRRDLCLLLVEAAYEDLVLYTMNRE